MRLVPVLAAVAAVFATASAHAYQVQPVPFAPNSTDQSVFYWSGDTGPVEGIAVIGSDFSGSPAPGLGDTQWEIMAPGGGIVLDFLQVYSAIEQSNYTLRDNGAVVPWTFIDNNSGQYSYNNLISYTLTPGLHIFTVEVLNSSGPYTGGLGPLGPDQYSWAIMTFNTDPGVAPAVPLPASGLALTGGVLALLGLRHRRRRRI
jgi:hypothetical protein